MIEGSTYSHVFFTFGKVYTTKKNLPDFKPVLSLSLTSLKIYIVVERKERKKEKILVYVEEYLQEVPLSC
jgi:hypothetical protein